MKSILLVDDDAIANYLHLNLINNFKISEKVDIVTNGEEAFKFIYSFGHPDLILLDLHMPVMDGIQFLQTFRKILPESQSKIYILTSSEHQNDIIDCKNWGIDGYVIKPLTEAKLETIFLPDHLPLEGNNDLKVQSGN